MSGFVWVRGGWAEEPELKTNAVRAIPATGFWSDAGAVPKGFDPAFAQAFYGWTASKSGSAAAYHFSVMPRGEYVVAIGFFDPKTKRGIRLQDILIDGKKVDRFDPVGPQPFVRLYKAVDLNGDGYLEVSCSQVNEESGATGMMNIVWIFAADQRGQVSVEKLARGLCPVQPLCRIDSDAADRIPLEHVNFPKLSEAKLKRMLPLRPVALGLAPARPQPVDPLNLEIQGELRGRVRSVLDRWGYAGRDQKFVAHFLSDAGFDTAGRALEVYCMFSRLLKIDLNLEVPFQALLERQARDGVQAGAFLGGAGMPRLACSWEQGTLLQAMLAYYEHSGGDPRALEAAGRIVDWEDRMVSGKVNAGSWGGDGRFGALEALTNYAWRAKDSKALQVAKRIAEINRGKGGIAWMIRGEPAREHMHSCLTTLRGFPWLYAHTGDLSYLNDAIAGCDRIYDSCTWENGCVAEFTAPAAKHSFPNDETCCTADELMLSYQLADLTGNGRFFDRGDLLYYNALRFHQWFTGNFSCYDDPYVGLKGPHAWYCCTWWGAKALYETARHLYAFSPTEVYVNGRVQLVQPSQGYLSLHRDWQEGDRVDVHFNLPLRVALDDGQGPTPLAEGNVRLDGARPARARSIVIYRGPVVLAQFRLQDGCDLIWAYTGDDPHLFETVASAPDEFKLAGKAYRPTGVPDLVEVAKTPSEVRLVWSWKTGPAGDWEVRRSALVKPGVPVEIEYSAEITAPPSTPSQQIEEIVQNGRFCGTRMQYSVSAPSTYFDKTGHPISPRLVLDGLAVMPTEKQWFFANKAELDNDFVRYQVRSTTGRLMACDNKEAKYSAIYSGIVKENGRWVAKCRLMIAGQSRFN